MRPTLKEAIAERSSPDDVATAGYWHGKRAVVIRIVRREPQGFSVIVDDGGSYVSRDDVEGVLELEAILTPQPNDDLSFLTARNHVVWETHLAMKKLSI